MFIHFHMKCIVLSSTVLHAHARTRARTEENVASDTMQMYFF